MEKLKLSDLNLHDIGNKIQISGLIMSNGHTDYLCYLPGEGNCESAHLELHLQDWEKLIMQTDQMETEILAKDKTGKFVKILVRKSTRQIEAMVSWQVYKRDNYSCRYCGITGVPLTVDHLILWEEGGPSIESNLVSACRKCNKLRGNMQYEDWLKSEDYKIRSASLPRPTLLQNHALVQSIKSIPRKYHISTR